MTKITRTDKGGLDTDGDRQNDILFSVIPAEKQSFNHPAGATYQIQVENLRSDVSIDMWKKVRDIQGNEEYEKMDMSIGVGERTTVESVTLTDTGPRHPRVNPKVITATVKYRVAIGANRYPIEFDIEADCNDQGAKQGVIFDGDTQEVFVTDVRKQIVACAKTLLELMENDASADNLKP